MEDFVAKVAYKKLVGQVFAGTYKGLHKHKDYGTLRAVFEVDSKDPINQALLDAFAVIRKLNYQSTAEVSSIQLNLHGSPIILLSGNF